LRLHAIDDGDGVAVAALLEDRHVDGALSINAHDVVLERARVHRLADVATSTEALPADFSGISFIAVRVGKLAVRVDVEVLRAYAHIARRQNQIRAVDRLTTSFRLRLRASIFTGST
jgi:hypothetical protein